MVKTSDLLIGLGVLAVGAYGGAKIFGGDATDDATSAKDVGRMLGEGSFDLTSGFLQGFNQSVLGVTEGVQQSLTNFFGQFRTATPVTQTAPVTITGVTAIPSGGVQPVAMSEPTTLFGVPIPAAPFSPVIRSIESGQQVQPGTTVSAKSVQPTIFADAPYVQPTITKEAVEEVATGLETGAIQLADILV